MFSQQRTGKSGTSFVWKPTRMLPRGPRTGALIIGLAACAAAFPTFAATPIQGNVTAKFTLTFAPALPAGSSVSCSVSLVGSDVSAPTDSQYITVSASGSTGTCSVAVPYRWYLANTASTMTITYAVSTLNHTASAVYETIKVPSGATSFTLAVTL